MSIICYYNFNSKNASNTVLNVQTGLYDLSLNGTTNLTISSTYTKYGYPSLYRSAEDSAFGLNYYYTDTSLLGNSFTISFWIRTLNLGNSNAVLRLYTDTSALVSFYLANGGGTNSSNRIDIQAYGDSGRYSAYLKTSGFSNNQIWNANDWNNVTLTASYDGVNTDVNIYFNGSLVNYEFFNSVDLNASTTKITRPANSTAPIRVTGTIFNVSSKRLSIGNSPQDAGLVCYISNVYLINRAISLSDLTSILGYPCFLQGSKILHFDPITNTESYIPVETLQKGTLIKTFMSGYKPVSHIGFKTHDNPADAPDVRDRLYGLSHPEFEPLYLTGRHSVLRNDLSEKDLILVRKYKGDVYVTENHYRVPIFLDGRAKPYTDNAPVIIWHFALEHPDIYQNYGVMANGILVESSSAEYMTDRSNMELL